MKITIISDLQFTTDILRIKEKLTSKGHEVNIPEKTADHIGGVEDKEERLRKDVIKEHYKKIQEADAILVINKTKNGIPHHIGGNSLIQMAFAHINDKKIYILHPIPHVAYKDEIEAMKPICIEGDINKIEESK